MQERVTLSRAKEIMYFKNHIIESAFRSLNGLYRPKRPQQDGILSPQELRRIVAEMVG